MPTQSSRNPRVFALVAAASLYLLASSNAFAGHCGCEPSCASCPTIVSGCSCDCACGKKTNCLQKAFDAVAAGLDKLFHLDKCGCDEALCDDACDAVMIEELMLPAPATIHHHDHSDHIHDDHHDPAQHHNGSHIEEVPPPVRLPKTGVPAVEEPKKERGSLFDTLSDPFNDDQTRLKKYRPIRPSAYLRPSENQEVELRPISRHEPSKSHSRSSRRTSSIR